MEKFKGEEYIPGTGTWTPEYDQWRRDNNLCNSPRAWVGMKRRERREEEESKPDAPWWAYLLLPPSRRMKVGK